MNYRFIYAALIESRRQRSTEGVVEKHHVVPRCIGGDDGPDNLVSLTPREHYVAHRLLTKIYPKVVALHYAVWAMAGLRPYAKKKSREYERIRRTYSEQKSRDQKGKPRPPEYLAAMHAASRGVSKSEEHREKLRQANLGKKFSEERKAGLKGRKTRGPLSADEISRVSALGRETHYKFGNKSRTGMKNSAEMRAKIGAAHRGRKHSEEWRRKQSVGSRKIKAETIVEIRTAFASGKVTQKALSDKYCISQTHISRILCGRCYQEPEFQIKAA